MTREQVSRDAIHCRGQIIGLRGPLVDGLTFNRKPFHIIVKESNLTGTLLLCTYLSCVRTKLEGIYLKYKSESSVSLDSPLSDGMLPIQDKTVWNMRPHQQLYLWVSV